MIDQYTDCLYPATLVIDCSLNQEIGDVEGPSEMKQIGHSNCFHTGLAFVNWLAI